MTAEGKPMTFSVSPKTMVIGTGVGTKIRELKEAGKGATVPDLVGINDEVIVTYQDKMASEIRIAMKAR
ncbi:MAG: hypothetical protein EHM57_08175 [Actinobacteria bacterium]|nr:MAG: hypothetical protein EHM57_08175 [Actinomycetota bacterium]